MSMRKSLLALACAGALSVALAACGGTPAGGGEGEERLPDLAALQAEFVGSWELCSAEIDELSLAEEDYDELTELGMHVTLDLDENGDLLVDAFGEQQRGSWEIVDENTLSLSLGDDAVETPYEDGELTLTYDGDTMVFEKAADEPNMERDPAENSGGGIAQELRDLTDDDGSDDGSAAEGDDAEDDVADSVPSDIADLLSEQWVLQNDLYVATVTQTDELGVTVCDSELAKITIDGIGYDTEGDTGYLVTVENRGNVDVLVTNVSTTLDGTDVWAGATLGVPALAGQTTRGFFFFEQEYGEITPESSCDFILGLYDADENLLDFCEVSL